MLLHPGYPGCRDRPEVERTFYLVRCAALVLHLLLLLLLQSLGRWLAPVKNGSVNAFPPSPSTTKLKSDRSPANLLNIHSVACSFSYPPSPTIIAYFL